MKFLCEILRDATEEFSDRVEDHISEGGDVWDLVHEIADSSIPVFNRDLLSTAQHSLEDNKATGTYIFLAIIMTEFSKARISVWGKEANGIVHNNLYIRE